jgi:predicted transcriptional regulator
MSSPIINVNYEDLATYAAGLMVKERINGLSVLGNGVKGILTGENIIKTILTM